MSSEDSGGFLDWFWDFVYGPPKREKTTKPVSKDEDKETIVEEDSGAVRAAPKAEEEQLLAVLHVTAVDLNIPENTKSHRTHKYACTKAREVNGVKEEPELVLRRGQTFKVTVTFDRPFDLKRDDIRFAFKTGSFPNANAATNGMFTVDETGETKTDANEWSGRLLDKVDNSLHVEVNVPANCAIGEWSLSVDTKTNVKEEKTQTFRYEHSDDIFILFNPWCKDDQTYQGNSEALEEYVLNDHGCVYRGNAWMPKAKEWNFGQYEEGILDASLYIICKCLKAKQWYQLNDPIKVARIIAQVVNCNDADKGVLHGRWDGKYEDGDSPLDWYGSVRILRQYIETGKPVKYGQCWVFSGVTTTVCRAIGLPARSVTNYNSAHDTDESNTIDIYYARNDDNELVRDDSSDSIWNYHVWNEVWLARTDIVCSKEELGQFDGWQAIDATPQERSNGVFTCGPCPVYAIKHGLVNTPYDGNFIFSEVNADECHWEPTPDGHRRFKLTIDKVGKSISTKKSDGKPYDNNAWFDRARNDITENYKYPEHADGNRSAVMRAALGARKPKEAYEGDGEKEDIVFKLLHSADLPLGKDVEVTLSATNTSDYRRNLTHITFRFVQQSYNTSRQSKQFKVEQIKKETELEKNKENKFKVILKHSEYLPHLGDDRIMCIQAYAFVEATRSRPLQNCVKAHVVEFGGPVLDVKMPAKVKVGKELEATVTFNNPLDAELTSCKAGYEGGGFDHVTGVKQDNVAVLGTFTGKFKMTATSEGTFTLTFKFTSTQLKYLSGSAQVLVEA